MPANNGTTANWQPRSTATHRHLDLKLYGLYGADQDDAK